MNTERSTDHLNRACPCDRMQPGSIAYADLGDGLSILVYTCADCGADVERVKDDGPQPTAGAMLMGTAR